MRRSPPPLRFLAMVVGCWGTYRAAVLAPGWWASVEVPAAMEAAPDWPGDKATWPRPAFVPAAPASIIAAVAHPQAGRRQAALLTSPVLLPAAVSLDTSGTGPHPITGRPFAPPALQAGSVSPVLAFVLPALPPPAVAHQASPARRSPSRWSASAWLLVRDGGSGTFVPGSMLGGSQAGARITYRLNRDTARPLALSARAYLPIDRPQGAEVAAGIDWQPLARLPIHALLEWRQAVGQEGRSDPSLTLYGSFDRPIAGGRARVDGYAQAGFVGTRPDAFADGMMRAVVPVGPIELGGGAWGGAQPGAARLDIGPHMSASLPLGELRLRIAAEYRVRVAGDAAPASGPALTVSTGF